MKRVYSLMVMLFLLGINLFGNSCLKVNGTIEENRKGIEEVIIKVLRNGHPDTILATNAKGRFSINLNQDCEYNLIITKEGYLLQNVLFDTHLPNPEEYQWDYKFAMNLLPKVGQEDNDFILEPVAVIAYNDEIDEFEKLYTSERCMFNDKIDVYRNIVADNYEQAIVLADSAFMQKDYVLAKDLYNSAAQLNEANDYADIQLDIIKRIEAKERRLQSKFWKYVNTADVLLVDNELDKARKLYEKAIKLQPSEYATQQLNRIDFLESENSTYSIR